MKLEGDYHFDARVQDVWDALFDPAVLAAAMPGCEKLERVDGQFVGEMKIKIGPVSGTFAGKVELADVDEPRRYRMVVDGRGNAGFVKATAAVELAADGDGTRLRYDADAQVGGKLATVGQRLIDASSRAIVKQSLDNLHENVKIRAAAHHAAAGAAEAAAAAAESAAAAAPEPAAAAEPAAHDAAVAAEPAATSAAVAAEPAATAAAAATAVPGPAPSPAPEVTYKRAQASDFAAGVAREVGKSLAPWLIAIAVVIALGLWLLLR